MDFSELLLRTHLRGAPGGGRVNASLKDTSNEIINSKFLSLKKKKYHGEQ